MPIFCVQSVTFWTAPRTGRQTGKHARTYARMHTPHTTLRTHSRTQAGTHTHLPSLSLSLSLPPPPLSLSLSFSLSLSLSLSLSRGTAAHYGVWRPFSLGVFPWRSISVTNCSLSLTDLHNMSLPLTREGGFTNAPVVVQVSGSDSIAVTQGLCASAYRSAYC